MKPTLSSEHTAMMETAIDLLEIVYRQGFEDLDTFHMRKLSAAIGDLTFVKSSTSKHAAPLPVRVIQWEPV